MNNIKIVSFDFWNTLAIPNPEFARKRTIFLSEILDIPQYRIKKVYTETKTYLDNQAEELGVGNNVYENYITLLNRLEFDWRSKPHFIDLVIQIIHSLFLLNPPNINSEIIESLNILDSKNVSYCVVSNTNFISGFILDKTLKHQINKNNSFWIRMYSDLFGYSKPSKEIFEELLNLTSMIETPEMILHIGDNENTDGIGPTSVGMQSRIIKDASEILEIVRNINE